MRLKWTKHGAERGHTRLGRYGIPEIEKRILQSLNTAVEAKDGRAKVRFKLGRKRCIAILEPLDDEGVKALVITTYHTQTPSSRDSYNSSYLKNRSQRTSRVAC